MLFNFIITFTLVHSRSLNVLYLNAETIQESLRFQEREIFRDEFPCIDSNTTGLRQLVSFAIVLYNSGPDNIYLGPYKNYLRLNWELWDSTDQLSTGIINVTCVRDNRGDTIDLRYFTCLNGGLTPSTHMYLNEHTKCQWVDVTTLPSTSEYYLSLQLQPALDGFGEGMIDTEIIWVKFVPTQLTPLILASFSRSILFMIAFSLPFSIYFIVVLVMTTKRSKLFTSYRTYEVRDN